MSLPHVLLGLLSEKPRTGYELARAMREELDHVWRAEFSQIYPTLARLRRAGHVHLKVLGPRGGPRRNLYRVTAAGRKELGRWLAVPPPPQGRDAILARVAFLDVLPPAQRRVSLLAMEASLGEEVRRLRSFPQPGGLRSAARRGAIERLEAERRWLHGVTLRGEPGGPPNPPEHEPPAPTPAPWPAKKK